MIFIKIRYSIEIYKHHTGKEFFTDWIQSLNKETRARISARIARFEDGNFGDIKHVGDGVLEARFFFGPGYRLYFAVDRRKLVLLLIGGDKSTQANDIKKAREFYNLYWENKNANKKS